LSGLYNLLTAVENEFAISFYTYSMHINNNPITN